MVNTFEDGTIAHVDFGKALPGEMCSRHLAVLFNIKGVKNCVFAIPITSPKPKHFRKIEDYQTRNFLNMRYYWQHYIRQSDSVALLEQMRHISTIRISNFYYDTSSNIVILNLKEMDLLRTKVTKHIKNVLYK